MKRKNIGLLLFLVLVNSLFAEDTNNKTLEDFKIECQAGVSESCYQAGLKELYGSSVAYNKKNGLESLESGCKLGHYGSCKILEIRKK